MEGREHRHTGTFEGKMAETPRSTTVSTKLGRIAKLRKRVRDGMLLRLIDKWLKAGVMEDGMIEYPRAGTPQGGCVSPILANIYLHEVLDEWFMRQVAPRLVGRAHLIRGDR